MGETKLKVHGTYPLDTGEWGVKRTLTGEEVQALLNLESAPKIDGVFNTDYLWLNKGFIVLGMPQDDAINGITTLLLEQIGDVSLAGIPIGAQAVYLSDGQYILVEKTRTRAQVRVERRARSVR